ncbi:hypothetical protein [Streptomyces subrutilus]|uniref:DUF7848 domain-containing protein n=1 Tax=Streptomyces subrutilus TaxID=36818 RepID=UPI002E1156A3|nr:hypothetical protein OG479_27765 [Streptomyces subrutilus]
MSTVLRFVQHRIISHPRGEVTVSAQCLDGDCGWSALPNPDVASVDVECMAHTGRTGHPTFARRYEDVALVERVGE